MINNKVITSLNLLFFLGIILAKSDHIKKKTIEHDINAASPMQHIFDDEAKESFSKNELFEDLTLSAVNLGSTSTDNCCRPDASKTCCKICNLCKDQSIYEKKLIDIKEGIQDAIITVPLIKCTTNKNFINIKRDPENTRPNILNYINRIHKKSANLEILLKENNIILAELLNKKPEYSELSDEFCTKYNDNEKCFSLYQRNLDLAKKNFILGNEHRASLYLMNGLKALMAKKDKNGYKATCVSKDIKDADIKTDFRNVYIILSIVSGLLFTFIISFYIYKKKFKNNL